MEGIYEESAVKNDLRPAKIFKALMITASALFLITLLPMLLLAFGPEASPLSFAIVFVLIAGTVTTFCLRNKLFFEIDFALCDDELDCAKVINNNRRRRIVKTSVKGFEFLRSVDDPSFDYDRKRADKKHYAVADPHGNYVYTMFKDKTGKTNMLIMEITDTLIAKINRIAPATVMKK